MKKRWDVITYIKNQVREWNQPNTSWSQKMTFLVGQKYCMCSIWVPGMTVYSNLLYHGSPGCPIPLCSDFDLPYFLTVCMHKGMVCIHHLTGICLDRQWRGEKDFCEGVCAKRHVIPFNTLKLISVIHPVSFIFLSKATRLGWQWRWPMMRPIHTMKKSIGFLEQVFWIH
jgi:hypothetical protein